ncbi:MAG: hypothetical protein ACE10F_04210 [Candidatus Methylomirabilales bacterium]|jgi:hypothetical protein|nr:hypothetical protein [candidate division NC10 bacterium]MEC4669984.1 hypothetical protein [Nitrospirota bacterium]MEC4687777.1 hypothetical protein [Nitrospirota bacterium]
MSQPPDVFGIIKYLAEEKERMAKQKPPGIPAFIEWRDQTYVGSIQEIAPEYSREIVLLNKPPQPISEEFRDAVLALDKNRLRLNAEAMFDLRARIHILRRSGERLMGLTEDQQEFLQSEGVEITEETTGETITAFSPKYYADPDYKGTSRN